MSPRPSAAKFARHRHKAKVDSAAMKNHSLAEEIRKFDDVARFEELLKAVVADDRSILAWHVGNLHWKALRLLDGGPADTREKHNWCWLALRAPLNGPIRKDGAGSLLKSPNVNQSFLEYLAPLPSAAFIIYWEQAQHAPDSILRVHYLAVLWEGKAIWRKLDPKPPFSIPDVAQALIRECCSVLKVEMTVPDDFLGAGMRATNYLELAIFVAVRFSQFAELQALLPDLKVFAQKALTTAPHWSLALAELNLYLAQPDGKTRDLSLVPDAELAEWKSIVEDVQKKYDVEQRGDPKEVLDVLVKIECLLGAKVTYADFKAVGP